MLVEVNTLKGEVNFPYYFGEVLLYFVSFFDFSSAIVCASLLLY